MKIKKDNIEIEVNEQAQLVSLIVDGKSLLHDGKKDWDKIFPIIFPVLATSVAYEHDGKEYDIPRHGFWSSLDWDGYSIGDEIDMQAIILASKDFPFSLDVNIKFKLIDNGVVISTKLTNFGKESAFVHFGYHPAFVIDETSTLEIKGTPLQIDIEGKLTNKEQQVKKISDLEFGKVFDTLVYKDIKDKHAILKNKDYSLDLSFNTKNLQLWKPSGASFICVEPWEGSNDQEAEVITNVSDKKDIVEIKSTGSKTFIMEMLYKEAKK